MKEKINIAELLKDCPRGMELDCTMYDNLYFDYISNSEYSKIYPIHCYTEDDMKAKYPIAFTSYGRPSQHDSAKCVIFPKGKPTWEGFVPPYEFKDGDMVVTKTSHNFIFYSIYKGVENREVLTYVDYHLDSNRLMFNDNLSSLCFIDEIVEQRFATEEEKAKLFDAIKDNGYHWNKENKTLKKLVEPKFKVGDKIRHKTNNKDDVYEISAVYDDFYGFIDFAFMLDMKYQDQYELVPNKFDITTLKPFDKVLVRGGDGQKWTHDFFGFVDKGFPFVCVGYYVSQCIPYEGNEHLLGTADDCDEYFKTWE